MTTTPPQEALAFLTVLEATPPTARTACSGWTAHELVAHLAAGAAEVADLIEELLVGKPGRATRGFEEREAPYRAMPDEQLRAELLIQALRAHQAVDAMEQDGHDFAIDFTGWRMDASRLRRHTRSEAALHRWDLCGDDEVGAGLLSPPELTTHAVEVLGAMATLAESPAQRARRAGLAVPEGFCVALRSPGEADVLIRALGGTVAFELAPSGFLGPGIACDPAERLLMLWGRRPGQAGDACELGPADRAVLDAVLFAAPPAVL